jgi:hypothetical protein
MSTLPATPVCAHPKQLRQPEKPPAEVHGTCRWVQRPVASPDSPARKGVLSINGVGYLVAELLCPETQLPLGWTLTRPADKRVDAASYDVLIHEGELLCHCPDSVYRPDRPQGCKHQRALAAALAALEHARPLCQTCADRGHVPVAVDEVEPCPDCSAPEWPGRTVA